MVRVRIRGENVRKFLLEHVGKHPHDISTIAAKHFGVTRQAINKHLRRLVQEKSLTESGETRKRTYKLAPLVEWRHVYQITPEFEEHVVWEKDLSPALGQLPENVMDIWRYGLTELLNNAKDHSDGTVVFVGITKTAVDTRTQISDNGVGIFRKIQQALNLPDQRHAVLELSKGKLTTDPAGHTGEGVFFSSRMFDKFSIGSDQTFYGHQFGDDIEWIAKTDFPGGTSVFMELSNHTHRTTKEIFDKYTSEEDYGFNKTVVPVKLAEFGNDKLISRSQAKRVVARLELFKIILLDFTGVATIGQAFADEIFRVFARENPALEIYPIHANSEVMRMIQRARAPLPSSATA